MGGPANISPGRRQSPVEWDEIPFRSSVRPSVRLSEGLTKGSEGRLKGFLGLLEGSEGWPEGSEGQSEGGRTDGRKEFHPIQQDFVPYRGRCPKMDLGDARQGRWRRWGRKQEGPMRGIDRSAGHVRDRDRSVRGPGGRG